MTARVDATDYSTVVWCPSCAHFAVLANDRDDGYRRAIDHDQHQHPGQRQAAANHRRWQQRTALAA